MHARGTVAPSAWPWACSGACGCRVGLYWAAPGPGVRQNGLFVLHGRWLGRLATHQQGSLISSAWVVLAMAPPAAKHTHHYRTKPGTCAPSRDIMNCCGRLCRSWPRVLSRCCYAGWLALGAVSLEGDLAPELSGPGAHLSLAPLLREQARNAPCFQGGGRVAGA